MNTTGHMDDGAPRQEQLPPGTETTERKPQNVFDDHVRGRVEDADKKTYRPVNPFRRRKLTIKHVTFGLLGIATLCKALEISVKAAGDAAVSIKSQVSRVLEPERPRKEKKNTGEQIERRMIDLPLTRKDKRAAKRAERAARQAQQAANKRNSNGPG